jgi:hypothetical protein
MFYLKQKIVEKINSIDLDSDLNLILQFIDLNFNIDNRSDKSSNDSDKEWDISYDEQFLDESFISVNDYLRDDNIDPRQFFLQHNDIRKSEFAYIFGVSQGLHCVACKRFAGCCDCKYICGLSKPTGQTDKMNNYCQFKKCKFYTNDLNEVVHECEGIIDNNSEIYKFLSKDSRSCENYLINDFDKFDDVIKYIDSYNSNY